MKKTKIEWCDSTLNPVVGCTFGCSYCYAKKLNDRFKFIEDWNRPQFFPERLKQLDSKKPKNIFMNSMSDIADWGYIALNETKKAMQDNPQHNYLFLTKRPIKVSEHFYRYSEENVWFGVSVTKSIELDRVRILKNSMGIKKHFISFEPLHSHICLSYDDKCDWVIIGAETGNRKGKIIPKKEWIEHIVGFAKFYNIPVFMKDSLVSIMGEKNMLREFPKELKESEKND